MNLVERGHKVFFASLGLDLVHLIVTTYLSYKKVYILSELNQVVRFNLTAQPVNLHSCEFLILSLDHINVNVDALFNYDKAFSYPYIYFLILKIIFIVA